MSEMRPETDEELRTRIANAYGMWGAFLSHVIEARGKELSWPSTGDGSGISSDDCP